MLLTRRAFVGSTLGVVLVPRDLFAGLSAPDSYYFDLGQYGVPLEKTTSGRRATVLIGAGGNSLLYRNAGESLLIDCKYAPFGGVLRADAERLGFKPAAATVLNTHHHADHTGGNHAFRGLEIVAHPKCAERVRTQVEMYTSQADGAVDQLKDDPKRNLALGPVKAFVERADSLVADDFVPTRLLDSPQTDLTIGGSPVEVHHFGAGHTDNDLAVFFPDDNVLHTGDLLFNGLHPYMDPPGGADSAGWISSCERLVPMCDAETVVVPGHGPVGDIDSLRAQIAYFEKLRAAVKAELDKGTPKDEIQKMSWAFMDGLGFEQIRPRAIGAVVDELISGG